MLRTADLDYELPDGLIATAPASPRDAARLMVVHRATDRVEHRQVSDLPEYLRAPDLLVVNQSRVIPARFLGVRADTGGRIEGLFLAESSPGVWRVMLKGRRMKAGVRVEVRDEAGSGLGVALELIERTAEEGEEGAWVVGVKMDGGAMPGAVELLERIGRTPLPPYILAARKQHGESGDEKADRALYQTAYAGVGPGDAGSVAAPTAGLHFTPELLARLESGGVRRVEVTLHVGTGTFKPVETEFVEQHPMHAEWCSVPGATVRAVRDARSAGGRVVAVGTTSVRALESFDLAPSEAASLEKWTKILITPGRPIRNADVLMTNFHLPRSTLLALVAAWLPGGVEQLLGLYAEAIEEGYRFYSFGDAILVLP